MVFTKSRQNMAYAKINKPENKVPIAVASNAIIRIKNKRNTTTAPNQCPSRAFFAFCCNSDNVTFFHEERRNVNFFTVYGEVAVQNELTSLSAAFCHAHTVNGVVQSALQQNQQILTGHTGLTLCLCVEVAELSLEHTVVLLDLLLLAKLLTVLAFLLASGTVLTGGGASVIEGAFTGGATFALQKKLGAFSAALSAAVGRPLKRPPPRQTPAPALPRVSLPFRPRVQNIPLLRRR